MDKELSDLDPESSVTIRFELLDGRVINGRSSVWLALKWLKPYPEMIQFIEDRYRSKLTRITWGDDAEEVWRG